MNLIPIAIVYRAAAPRATGGKYRGADSEPKSRVAVVNARNGSYLEVLDLLKVICS
jgi:hypothetical protein